MEINIDEIIKDIYFADEAAAFLGVTKQRLCVLVKNGRLKPVKRSNRRNLFYKKDLDEYLKKREIIKNIWKAEN